ncbi:hypothetical protein [Paenibacillus spongiae]|uniref:LytTR family transcriptional regulator n=1 Tax=Paenibacillus spongiae TaxID=2909671 RepID=A0ABY5SEP1_9BACL|nr:hypothetical protein [Paenibacillus spongiae]UVI31955.1 hypothetical protein L1F29_09110 [Paenibacillus spongiae]
MMNLAQDNRNIYEAMEIEKDILYFKLGKLGLVSCHGRNYNIRKKLSKEQLDHYLAGGQFAKVSSNCFVNLSKIVSLKDGMVRFDCGQPESKYVQVSKWHQSHVKNLLSKRNHTAM